MNSKIKVNIYGVKDSVLPRNCGCSGNQNGCSGCSTNKNGCGNCSNDQKHCSGGCGASTYKNLGDLYKDLKNFLEKSDIKENIDIKFIDLKEREMKEEEELRVKEIIERGFEAPITVIDGIIRYYGGLSNTLVLKDVKELLE